MPDLEDFAFVVRLVAHTLGSNGSSSMVRGERESKQGNDSTLHMFLLSQSYMFSLSLSYMYRSIDPSRWLID